MKKQDIKITYIQQKHIKGFRLALDRVARERKYLHLLKAPALQGLRSFVRSIIKDKMTQYVALDGEKVVGWCDIVSQKHPYTKHVGKLGMGVLRNYRGQGIGTQLIQACLKHAKSRGLEKVELSVYSFNKSAIRLYKRIGFRLEGIRKKARKYKGTYEDILLMSKSLK
jgi:ribosomal protein S18 acetylase RimI-like enzyme